MAYNDDIGKLYRENRALTGEVALARRITDYWKGEHRAGNELIEQQFAEITQLKAEVGRLREALKFYAEPQH